MRATPSREPARRDLIRGAASLVATGALLNQTSRPAEAQDDKSRREALDDLDRLAALCDLRLGSVRQARPRADVLVTRFLATLLRHRSTREGVRRRFALPEGIVPAPPLEGVDADLGGLRQALDDLMVAYALSLPVFGDARVVSLLAVDMVDVSRCRTVIDLWVESERT